MGRGVIDVVDKKISLLELCHPAELVVLPVLPVKPALLIPSSSAHNTTCQPEKWESMYGMQGRGSLAHIHDPFCLRAV